MVAQRLTMCGTWSISEKRYLFIIGQSIPPIFYFKQLALGVFYVREYQSAIQLHSQWPRMTSRAEDTGMFGIRLRFSVEIFGSHPAENMTEMHRRGTISHWPMAPRSTKVTPKFHHDEDLF